jgi:hypothetical protein
MKELVSPEQADSIVLLAAMVLLLGGALWGWKTLGSRGVIAGLLGPLVFGLWAFHKWITRYDPQTGYFGLDKVKVLLLEIVLFVVLGAVLGVVWGNLTGKTVTSNKDAETLESTP